MKRHKQQTDDAERVEEDLKQERRRLQREVIHLPYLFLDRLGFKTRARLFFS